MIADTFHIKKKKVYVWNLSYYGKPVIAIETDIQTAFSFLARTGVWRHYQLFDLMDHDLWYQSVDEAKQFAESLGYEVELI